MEAASSSRPPSAYPEAGPHQSRKKLALLYLIFVGLPLLGVILVIQLGEPLTAPHAIKGRWTFETQGRIAPALECQPPASDKENCTLDIAQSGDQLKLSLAGAQNAQPLAFKGKLDGTDVKARAKPKSASGPDPAGESVQMRAGLEKASPEKLVGQLEVGGCPQPVLVQFHATREGKAP